LPSAPNKTITHSERYHEPLPLRNNDAHNTILPPKESETASSRGDANNTDVEDDNNIISSNDAEPIRSRQKEDIWHQFHALPLPKACPVKPLITWLLILATFTFVETDYNQVKSYLSDKDLLQ